MPSKNQSIILASEIIENKIFFIRGKKVMFDRDLAGLYGVETRALNQAVKRNIERFPEEFMFQLNKQELEIWQLLFLRSQIVTLKRGQHIKYAPYVFTEYGVAMLSGVLNSKRAIQVNIQIIKTFIKLKEMIATNRELRIKIEIMEKKYDKSFKIVFDTLRKLFEEKKNNPQKQIGFETELITILLFWILLFPPMRPILN
ncbi:MAG: ORF6N domain-containing protein [Patescibacteria group bacterium]|nr:ORF6N domain-containing protein [Patescibacteria group bacterium]